MFNRMVRLEEIDKINLALTIINKAGIQKDYDAVLSIGQSIRDERFFSFAKCSPFELIIFFTWEEDWIDGKKYVFINNLWVDENYRGKMSLVGLRRILRNKFKNYHKFYWHNQKRDKIVYRR